MNNHFLVTVFFTIAFGFFTFLLNNCDSPSATAPTNQPTSNSGVKQTNVQVKTNPNGRTNEQENIAKRIEQDNQTGAIKHLYVISAYSGDVLIYSTVKGKVTSSGKRLTPTSVIASEQNQYYGGTGTATESRNRGVSVNIAGREYYTTEVLQDDGTYGSSDPYIYWFDTSGIYHQHYVSGGQIIHVSAQPIAVRKIIINMEAKSIE